MRLLKQHAARAGSIAQVVRDLIDTAMFPEDPSGDPFFKHVVATRPGSGRKYGAERAKRELYARGR